MSPVHTHDLVILVDSPDWIFSAPAINPFSQNELEVLGISGLAYAMRQLQTRRRSREYTRLVTRLPADRIMPGFDHQLTEAVRRYCRAKAADNATEIHLIRLRSSIALGLLLLVALVVIAGTYLLFATLLAGVSQVIQVVVAAIVSLFAWVSIWDPLEALLFEPIALLRENFILRRLARLTITVEATSLDESQDASGKGTPDADASPTPSPVR